MTKYAPYVIKHDVKCDVCDTVQKLVYEFTTISAHARLEENTSICEECEKNMTKYLVEFFDESV